MTYVRLDVDSVRIWEEFDKDGLTVLGQVLFIANGLTTMRHLSSLRQVLYTTLIAKYLI